MSEKRITMKYSFEDEEYVFYDKNKALSPSEVRRLLNDMIEDNEELRKENEEIIDGIVDIIYSEFNECFLSLKRKGLTLSEALFFQEIKNVMFDAIDYRLGIFLKEVGVDNDE